MTTKKIIGWVLLAGGVSIILFSVYSSWQIFMGPGKAPEIFSVSAEAPSQNENQTAESFSAEQLSKTIQDQIKNILPAKYLVDILNYFSWSILAGIMIFAGSQLSSIGSRML